MFEAFIDSWKKIIDYKGTATRKQYWSVVLIDVLLFVIAFVFSLCYVLTEVVGFIILVRIIEVYLLVAMIPLVSLTVRRLHDTGRSGWWTCLLLAIGIGTIVVMLMCSFVSDGASIFNPENNYVEEVYGPPEVFDPDFTLDEEITELPEDADDFEVEINMNPLVYGPPEMFEEEPVESATEDEISEEEDFNPKHNVSEEVYGPPKFE